MSPLIRGSKKITGEFRVRDLSTNPYSRAPEALVAISNPKMFLTLEDAISYMDRTLRQQPSGLKMSAYFQEVVGASPPDRVDANLAAAAAGHQQVTDFVIEEKIGEGWQVVNPEKIGTARDNMGNNTVTAPRSM